MKRRLLPLCFLLSCAGNDPAVPAAPPVVPAPLPGTTAAAVAGTGRAVLMGAPTRKYLFLDSIPVLHIALTLFNPTSDTLRFVDMTCSHEDLFTTDTAALRVQSFYRCYSNMPTVTTLAPRARLPRELLVRPAGRRWDTALRRFRVGLYFLPPDTIRSFDGLVRAYEQRHTGKIVWSGVLEMPPK